jgi:hypothetical protein
VANVEAETEITKKEDNRLNRQKQEINGSP